MHDLLKRPSAWLAAALISMTAGPAIAQDDVRELNNLASCYVEGIDAIGAGNTDAGAALWRQCFSDDLRFEMNFGPSFSMVCQGDKCPFPASMNGLARRVALARGTFERSGYVATSHHVTSLGIERAQPDAARIKGHLQAWHFRKDGTAVLGLGTWQVEARKTASGWRIVDELLVSPMRVVIPKADIPKTE